MAEFEDRIGTWSLIPATGGLFEVQLGDELVFSKKAAGRHPTAGELRQVFAARLPGEADG